MAGNNPGVSFLFGPMKWLTAMVTNVLHKDTGTFSAFKYKVYTYYESHSDGLSKHIMSHRSAVHYFQKA